MGHSKEHRHEPHDESRVRREARELRDARDRIWLRIMAAGFGTGSALFVIGGVLSVFNLAQANGCFAVGAICFTLGALAQWRTAVIHDPRFKSARVRAELGFDNPDWTSAIIQLAGTLYFNVMTIHALSVEVFDPAYESQVWTPDAIGSALFLISSIIALHSASRQRRHRLLTDRSAAIVWLNIAGSVLFAISAIGAAAVVPGELKSVAWANLGTITGGACFLAASVLLIPKRTQAKGRNRTITPPAGYKRSGDGHA